MFGSRVGDLLSGTAIALLLAANAGELRAQEIVLPEIVVTSPSRS